MKEFTIKHYPVWLHEALVLREMFKEKQLNTTSYNSESDSLIKGMLSLRERPLIFEEESDTAYLELNSADEIALFNFFATGLRDNQTGIKTWHGVNDYFCKVAPIYSELLWYDNHFVFGSIHSNGDGYTNYGVCIANMKNIDIFSTNQGRVYFNILVKIEDGEINERE